MSAPQPWHFTTWLDLLDHWQSLAAGLVAVFAASIAIGGTELFARLKEHRERNVILLSLAAEVRVYLLVFIRTREIIQRLSPQEAPGIVARDLKAVMELPSPVVFPAAANRIGLLGPRIADGLVRFNATYEAVNLMARITAIDPDGAVDEDTIGRLVSVLERACRDSLPLLAELPHENADAALKKTIESFAHQADAGLGDAPPGP
jgi:hypothetical protein